MANKGSVQRQNGGQIIETGKQGTNAAPTTRTIRIPTTVIISIISCREALNNTEHLDQEEVFWGKTCSPKPVLQCEKTLDTRLRRNSAQLFSYFYNFRTASCA